jgi:glycosyltransferase involved in cell wall biosynthesis
MKNVILCTNAYPGPYEEPFLAVEVPYLEKIFSKIYVQRYETKLTPYDVSNICMLNLRYNSMKLRTLFWRNKGLLIKAWLTELFKSGRPLFYLSNMKRFIHIWVGWLQDSSAWEEALKSFDPKDTVIYSYWYENQAMPLSILNAQNKLNFTWVSRAHGWDVDKRQRNDGVIPFRHWMLKHKPDKLVSISEFGKNIFNNDYNVDVQVQRLGTKDFGMASPPSLTDPLSIVSISSLIPLKRVHLIIDCLKQCNVPIVWTHFGEGPLRGELPWESLPKNIKVIRNGHIEHDQLLRELKRTTYDLMIHLSELEGIPVSIMECMSFGIPVIACDTGGISEIVDNDCGWLLPVNFEIERVSNLLDEIVQNREIANQKRPLARAKWEKEYQADVNFPAFIHSFLSNNKK